MTIDDQITTFITSNAAFISLLIVAVTTLWAKDFITDLVASIRWKLKKSFEPGDNIYLDGEPAIIVSINLRETIFQIERDGQTYWRYVDNTRIPYLKLEKRIDN